MLGLYNGGVCRRQHRQSHWCGRLFRCIYKVGKVMPTGITMTWLSGITTTCFGSSYAVCLILEVSRLFFRMPVRLPVIFGFAIAGLFAHTAFLTLRVQQHLGAAGVTPLSSWFDFCMVAAWLLAAAYLVVSLRRPRTVVGIFLLPPVLGLIGIGLLWQDAAVFRPEAALSIWRWIHGLALTGGTATVTLGFATGLMYLVQAARLKRKLPPSPRFQLPSLEWLQRCNREALIASTCLLFVGLISGVILNLSQPSTGRPSIAWTDPVALSSGVLFLWLVAVVLFEWFYKPARQGNKVAYLTVASFVFLGLALYFVLFGKHAVS